VILRLTILLKYQLVRDGQTHDDSIYHARIALCGKNWRCSEDI